MQRFTIHNSSDLYRLKEDKDFQFDIDNLPLNIDYDHSDGTPLMLAAKEGLLDFVKLLIKGKASIAVSKEIREAISFSLEPIIKIIEEYDNAYRHNLFKPLKIKPQESLIEAARNGHTKSVKQILESKTINVNIEGETNYINLMEHGMTPLMWAAHNGHINIVKELVKHKANVELQRHGDTALKIANMHGRKKIVEFLSYQHSHHSMKSGR